MIQHRDSNIEWVLTSETALHNHRVMPTKMGGAHYFNPLPRTIYFVYILVNWIEAWNLGFPPNQRVSFRQSLMLFRPCKSRPWKMKKSWWTWKNRELSTASWESSWYVHTSGFVIVLDHGSKVDGVRMNIFFRLSVCVGVRIVSELFSYAVGCRQFKNEARFQAWILVTLSNCWWRVH